MILRARERNPACELSLSDLAWTRICAGSAPLIPRRRQNRSSNAQAAKIRWVTRLHQHSRTLSANS
jgi:hypothetical protein